MSPDTIVSVIKSDSCESLSKKSMLGYQVGYSDEKDICIRIISNTAKGLFGKDWFLYSSIDVILREGTPLKASTLSSLFKGKSANTPGFIMAILKHLEVIKLVEGSKHQYEYMGAVAFESAAQGWSESVEPMNEGGDVSLIKTSKKGANKLKS